jgi:membrane-anchored protein YejM (alkaline phosphatase superfamily)
LLIINESTGGFFKSAQNNALSLATRIQNIASTDSNNWLQFKYAVTNGPLTDISLPSIMTGSGSYEGYKKIHSLPFLWDLAKARGYETVYFTSQIIHWAHFDNFFRFAQIDHLFSAETWHLPLMNDFGIDDIIMARQAAQYILHSTPDKKIFLVVFTNALHYPYQEKSILQIPATITSRHAKATYILEEAHRLIFDALVKSSRYQQSLIIINADHGEDIFKTRDIPRGDGGQYEEILRIPFLMHVPANFSAKIKKTLRFNTKRLVSNLDIAPTLADILGLRLPNQYKYSGYSLLKKIPGNRLSICVSTNEWRKWPIMGLTLARGSDRFICMSKKSCAYYNLNIDPNEKNPIHIGSKYTAYLKKAMTIPILRYEIHDMIH